MAIETGDRYRFGWFKEPGVFENLSKLTQTPKKAAIWPWFLNTPQKNTSPGMPIGISQLRVAMRAITNKRSIYMKIFCWALMIALLSKCGLRWRKLSLEFIFNSKIQLQLQYCQISNFNVEVEVWRWRWTLKSIWDRNPLFYAAQR